MTLLSQREFINIGETANANEIASRVLDRVKVEISPINIEQEGDTEIKLTSSFKSYLQKYLIPDLANTINTAKTTTGKKLMESLSASSDLRDAFLIVLSEQLFLKLSQNPEDTSKMTKISP